MPCHFTNTVVCSNHEEGLERHEVGNCAQSSARFLCLQERLEGHCFGLDQPSQAPGEGLACRLACRHAMG